MGTGTGASRSDEISTSRNSDLTHLSLETLKTGSGHGGREGEQRA